jgi:hypothetical protein
MASVGRPPSLLASSEALVVSLKTDNSSRCESFNLEAILFRDLLATLF